MLFFSSQAGSVMKGTSDNSVLQSPELLAGRVVPRVSRKCCCQWVQPAGWKERNCPRCFRHRREGEKGKETTLGRREPISLGYGGSIPGASEVCFSLCDAEHLPDWGRPSLTPQIRWPRPVLLPGLRQILRRGNQLHQALQRGRRR